ncbi:uncharacterized protein [Cardiocondyla obscurior]|uniref:uncharacterized protein n=1 Tax=Cardiocondyla obscurior TaxID=286306 RepID=UPI00396563A0
MYRKMWTVFDLTKIVSVIVINVLDSLLFLMLLPFIIWEWISKRPYIINFVKIIIEVTLELIMWIIFAGVSIFVTVIFTFDDIYCNKAQNGNNLKYLYPSNNKNKTSYKDSIHEF